MPEYATAAQIIYIKKLDEKLGYDSDERDFFQMTRKQASNLIAELKDELGV